MSYMDADGLTDADTDTITATSNSNTDAAAVGMQDTDVEYEEPQAEAETGVGGVGEGAGEDQQQESDEAPKAKRLYTCSFCGARFDSLTKIRGHIFGNHADEYRKRRETMKAKKAKGVRGRHGDDEREEEEEGKETAGMEESGVESESESEDEIIARYHEQGILMLKRKRLVELLDVLPVSKRAVRYVLSFYDRAELYQRDNNELANLLKSAGIPLHLVDQTMRILIAWEREAYIKLQQLTQSASSPSSYYYYYPYPQYQYQQQYPPPSSSYHPYPPYQPQSQYQYQHQYHNQPQYQPPYSHIPGAPPPAAPFMPAAPMPSMTPSIDDIRRIIREEMREKEKKTELDRFKEEVNSKIEMLLSEIKNRKTEKDYIEYEEVVLDPVTMRPMLDENGQPIKILKRMPLDALPTSSSNNNSIISSKNSDPIAILERLIQMQSSLRTDKSEKDEYIRELKDQIARLETELMRQREDMDKREKERLERELETLKAELRGVRNSTDWNNDAARLLAVSIDKGFEVLKEKQPIRDIAHLLLAPYPVNSQPPPKADSTGLEEAAAATGLLDNR